jgi:hypothetical protein
VLSYAGVPLLVPTPEMAGWVAANLDPSALWEFQSLAWPGHRRILHWTHTPAPPPPRVRLGVLRWPRGASRFAVFHGLATDAQLDLIRPQLQGPSLFLPAPFVMSWDDAALPLAGVTREVASVETLLYMLPPRPLQQIADRLPGRRDLYLITLVDERYFWWYKTTFIPVTAGTTTWAQLYTAIGDALGVAIEVDPVELAYLTPPAGLAAAYEYLPLLLDAVAFNVGHRVTRALDGTVRAEAPLAAADRADGNATLLLSARSRQAGGEIHLSPLRPWADGLTDLPAVLPDAVRVVFRSGDSATADRYVKSIDFGSLNLSDLPNTLPRHEGTKTFHDTATATFSGGSATNQTALDDLTEQVARDYYRWAAYGLIDVKYRGVVPWDPDGAHDCVEWTYLPGEVSTRIIRPPWNDLTQELRHVEMPVASGGVGPDEKVKVSSNDATAGYLSGKLGSLDGSILFAETGDGGNETFLAYASRKGASLSKAASESVASVGSNILTWNGAGYNLGMTVNSTQIILPDEELYFAGATITALVPAGVSDTIYPAHINLKVGNSNGVVAASAILKTTSAGGSTYRVHLSASGVFRGVAGGGSPLFVTVENYASVAVTIPASVADQYAAVKFWAHRLIGLG